MRRWVGLIVENATRSVLSGMPHFLLIYRDRRCARVIIVQAPSLAGARTIAATVGLDTANAFRLGHELEAELIPLVRPEQIGRILTAAEAKRLLTQFEARLSNDASRRRTDLRAAE